MLMSYHSFHSALFVPPYSCWREPKISLHLILCIISLIQLLCCLVLPTIQTWSVRWQCWFLRLLMEWHLWECLCMLLRCWCVQWSWSIQQFRKVFYPSVRLLLDFSDCLDFFVIHWFLWFTISPYYILRCATYSIHLLIFPLSLLGLLHIPNCRLY